MSAFLRSKKVGSKSSDRQATAPAPPFKHHPFGNRARGAAVAAAGAEQRRKTTPGSRLESDLLPFRLLYEIYLYTVLGSLQDQAGAKCRLSDHLDHTVSLFLFPTFSLHRKQALPWCICER